MKALKLLLSIALAPILLLMYGLRAKDINIKVPFLVIPEDTGFNGDIGHISTHLLDSYEPQMRPRMLNNAISLIYDPNSQGTLPPMYKMYLMRLSYTLKYYFKSLIHIVKPK